MRKLNSINSRDRKKCSREKKEYISQIKSRKTLAKISRNTITIYENVQIFPLQNFSHQNDFFRILATWFLQKIHIKKWKYFFKRLK